MPLCLYTAHRGTEGLRVVGVAVGVFVVFRRGGRGKKREDGQNGKNAQSGIVPIAWPNWEVSSSRSVARVSCVCVTFLGCFSYSYICRWSLCELPSAAGRFFRQEAFLERSGCPKELTLAVLRAPRCDKIS
jgi:hypothetical protein